MAGKVKKFNKIHTTSSAYDDNIGNQCNSTIMSSNLNDSKRHNIL